MRYLICIVSDIILYVNIVNKEKKIKKIKFACLSAKDITYMYFERVAKAVNRIFRRYKWCVDFIRYSMNKISYVDPYYWPRRVFP